MTLIFNVLIFFNPDFRPAEPEEVSSDFLETLINEIDNKDLFIEHESSDSCVTMNRINSKKEDIFNTPPFLQNSSNKG